MKVEVPLTFQHSNKSFQQVLGYRLEQRFVSTEDIEGRLWRPPFNVLFKGSEIENGLGVAGCYFHWLSNSLSLSTEEPLLLVSFVNEV